MKKIKLFLVTLLSVVGVMNAVALDDVINLNKANTVQGKFKWVQETPEKGHSYKIVNCMTDANRLVAISPRNNNASGDTGQSSETSILVNDIVLAGEWLYGEDDKITGIYNGQVVGVYESHLKLFGFTLTGATVGTPWFVEKAPACIDDSKVDGYHISCDWHINLIIWENTYRCYLKLSSFFDTIDEDNAIGNLGWSTEGVIGDGGVIPGLNDDRHLKQHYWNFYSMEQYRCYVAFKTAYEEFDKLNIEDYKGNENYQELKKLYDALVAELSADDYVAYGYDENTRDVTYEMVGRMLDMIATLNMANGVEIDEDGKEVLPKDPADGWLLNPGAESQNAYWSFTTMPTGNSVGHYRANNRTNSYPVKSGSNSFELRNATMSQMVDKLPSGIYTVSMYWRTTNNNAKVVFSAISDADENSVKMTGRSNSYSEAKFDIVVEGGVLTVSATVETGSTNTSVFIDDFKLEYKCKNYWYDDAATKTRVYKGVFDLKREDNVGIEPATADHPERHLNQLARAVVTDAVPYADITKAYFVDFKYDNSDNPNGFCYATAGKIIKGADGGAPTNVVVYDAKTKKNNCSQLALTDGHPYSTKWTFDAKDAKYTMSSFGEGKDDTDAKKVAYGTLILPYDVDAETINANGVVVYKPTAIDEKGHLTLQKSSTIAADVPYIVQYTDADAQTKLFEAFSTFKTVEPCDMVVDGGYLVGTYEKTKVPYADGNCYLLQLQNGKLAFYPVKKDGLHCNPFRCYLKLPVGTNPSRISLVFEDDDTTGINEVENAVCADELYDLSGRRVENMSRPGVYVKNGKKVLVK